jgi:hypothetical protein
MLSSLQNLSAQIHIFWREIFEICVFVYQIQVKKGVRFAPVINLAHLTLGRYWSVPKTHFANRIYTFTHFSTAWCKNLCKFTQIMCKLHKSWSTRGHRQPSTQITFTHLHNFFSPMVVPSTKR